MWFDIIKADPPYVGRKGGSGKGGGLKWARELSGKKHIDMMNNLLLKLKQEIPQLNWISSGFVKNDKGPHSIIHQPFNEITQVYIFHNVGASDSEFLLQFVPPVPNSTPKYFTAEEIITKIKKHIIEPTEKAEQLVIETANKLDYVTINGDWIEIELEWGKNMTIPLNSGFKGPINMKYVFNMNNIHDELCITRVITDSTGDIHEEDICLSENKTFNAPIADSYVTTMLMAGNENNWKSMWDDA